MRLPHLILREIAHRKVNSLLALISVTAAVACLVAGLTLLRGHDIETARILSHMQAEAQKQLAALRAETEARTSELVDDYRKIALELGFNVFILPKDAARRPDAPAAEMPYDYVKRLAAADIITIEHLLPSLSAPVFWQEHKLQVVLTGIHGEVAKAGGKAKKPLIQPVLPGQIALGQHVAKEAKLNVGDKTALLGERFTVSKIHPHRGTQDDFTVWIDLAQAQKLLGKEGKITAIQAINCLAPNCHPDATGIPSVSQEIAKVLPDTQVLIDMSKAMARIENRQRAVVEKRAALEQEDRRAAEVLKLESQRRAEVRGQIESFASLLTPVVVLGCGFWIGLLALTNARERRHEIGILRALGLRSGAVMALFLGKAVLIGAIGAAVGFAAGMTAGAVFSHASVGELASPPLTIGTLLAAPLLAALATWLPAMMAAQQDPAAVLSEE